LNFNVKALILFFKPCLCIFVHSSLGREVAVVAETRNVIPSLEFKTWTIKKITLSF